MHRYVLVAAVALVAGMLLGHSIVELTRSDVPAASSEPASQTVRLSAENLSPTNIEFGGFTWTPDAPVPIDLWIGRHSGAWTYHSQQLPNMRLIENRDAMKIDHTDYETFRQQRLIYRIMEAVDPRSGKWVSHGLGIDYDDDGTPQRYSVHEEGFASDPGSVGVPPPEQWTREAMEKNNWIEVDKGYLDSVEAELRAAKAQIEELEASREAKKAEPEQSVEVGRRPTEQPLRLTGGSFRGEHPVAGLNITVTQARLDRRDSTWGDLLFELRNDTGVQRDSTYVHVDILDSQGGLLEKQVLSVDSWPPGELRSADSYTEHPDQLYELRIYGSP